MKNLNILIALACLFLASCSDSASPSKSKIQPLTIGSYWIYDVYDLDTNNTGRLSQFTDSSVVVGDIEMIGQMGRIIRTFSVDRNGNIDNEIDNYYYETNAKLYMHSKAFTEFFSSSFFPIEMKEQWMKIADKNDEDWKVYEETLPETIGPMNMKFSGKIIVNGEKGGTRSFTVGNKELKTDEYLLFINFNGNATTSLFPLPIPINFDRVMKLYYADGVGLVSQKMESMRFSLAGFDLPLPGTETILKRYVIK